MTAKSLLRASIVGAITVAVPCASRADPEARQQFSIPAQPLSSALLVYGSQAGVSIAAPDELLTGRQSAALAGIYTQADGLKVMLEGSDLAFDYQGPDLIRVYRPRSKLTLSPAAGPPVNSQEVVLEDIVVLARRKEERAQSVPISMTTFSAQDFADLPRFSFNDLERNISALAYPVNFGANATSPQNIWVRGIPGLVTYFADAPFLPYGGSAYFDVASVDVLKGPQGTLFGIATNGGAMVIQPKAPTNRIEGHAQIEAGSFGHRELEGVLNFPLVKDKLFIRLGAQTNHTDGYVYNISNHEKMNDVNYSVDRVFMTLRPTDSLQNDLLFNYYDWHDNNFVIFPNRYNTNGYIAQVYGAAGAAAFQRQQNQLGWYTVWGNAVPGGTYRSGTELNLIDTTRWEVSDSITAKNILAYQEINAGAVQSDGLYLGGDLDLGLPANAAGRYNTMSTPESGPVVQYSEELQIFGALEDRKITYTLGTFNEWMGARSPVNISVTTALGGTNAARNYTDYWSHALYGQGTYDLSDFVPDLSFTAGYRYTWDKLYSFSASYNPTTFAQISSLGATGAYSAPSYTLGLEYHFGRSGLLYITDNKGYSKGGVNADIFVPNEMRTYGPESLDNIEIGVKADWKIDGITARTNLSAFYGFYDNVQALTSLGVPGSTPGTTIQVAPRLNAATAHTEGFEWQLTAIPLKSFQVTFAGAYVHLTYDKWLSPTGQDLRDSSYLYAPKWKYNLQAAYQLPIDEALGRLSVEANFTYTSTRYNVTVFQPTLGEIDPAWHDLDLSVRWANVLGQSDFDLRVYATNVLEGRYIDGGYAVYRGTGIQGEAHAPPRMWGASMKYSFGAS